MARVIKIQPSDGGTPCIECGKKIYASDEYYYAKKSKMGTGTWAYKGYNFIHKKCYEKMCKKEKNNV